MSTPLNEIPAEDFEPLIGTTLNLGIADGEVPSVLEQVCRSRYPTGRQLPGFSLLLRGPLDNPLAQGLITLQHPRHGALQLFMTPVGKDRSGYSYEIVFN
jgi:hypothetical protein